jgi:type I restriction enzyme S subunit
VYHAIAIGRDYFRRLQRGVRQKNLNLSMVRDIKIPMPTVSLQREFVRRLRAMDVVKAAHHESELGMRSLFAGLQSRAFAGQL